VSQSSGKPAPADGPGGFPERALKVSLAGLLVMLPFSHTTAMIRLLLAVALASALVLAWRSRSTLREGLPPFLPALLAWMLWCIASATWSVDLGITFPELRAEFLYGAATVFAAHMGMTCERPERLLFPAAALVSILLGAASLFWTLTGYASQFAPGVGYTSSTVLVLFPVGCIAVMVPGLGVPVRRLGIAMVVALLVAGLTTFNRTLGPALALEVVAIAILLPGRARLLRRLAVVLAAALAFAALQAGVAHVVRFMGEDATAYAEMEDPRRALWPHVATRIAEAPLLGRGYGREIIAPDLRETIGNPLVTHAHNIFLGAGVQLGIPGIVLLAVLFGSIALTGFRHSGDDDPLARACGAAMVAIVVGTVTRNLSDDLWVRQNALLFWLVILALSGFAGRLRRGRSRALSADERR